jgi:predicted enzyme related to lactoylglutathione lyase
VLGGAVAVEPFAVDGMVRIALIVDPVGGAFGLWEEP